MNSQHDKTASHPHPEQPVPVAACVNLPAPAAEKARLRFLLGVEAHDLRAVARYVGQEADRVILTHWVIERDEPFVLHRFDADSVRAVGRFRFKRRQRHAAARRRTLAYGPDCVAAHGANVEPAAHEVGRAVRVDDVFARKQRGQRYAQRRGQRLQQRNIGQPAQRFPFGNGLVADGDQIGQLLLRVSLFLAQRADGVSSDVAVPDAFLLAWAGVSVS